VARAGFFALFCLISLLGSTLAVCTLGRSVYRWHGFAIELRLLPSAYGQTRLALMPLGEVQARTHVAPVALVATLQEIRIDEVQKLLGSRLRREDLARDFQKSAQGDLRLFVARQFGVAALGALLAPLLWHSRRLRVYVGSSLIGVLGVAVVLGNVFTTFNRNAFDSPTYTGALKQAPWVIQFSKDAFLKIEALSEKLRTVASNLNLLYGRIERLPGLPEGDQDTFRVLHVSDIHDNIAAMQFIRQVADQFKVDMIVDTGDLTDYGSPPETAIVKDIARMHMPYVFVLGNHDSLAVATALLRVPEVTLLNGKIVNVQGLTLLGLPNPASARPGPGNVNETGPGSVTASQADLDAGSAELLRLVSSQAVPPDIVAIHDPVEAQALWGRVPLILCGHEHRYSVETRTLPPPGSGGQSPVGAMPDVRAAYNTVVCNAGTTGAAGLRYLDKESGTPFSCAVLTFRRPHPLPPQSVGPTNSPAPAGGSGGQSPAIAAPLPAGNGSPAAIVNQSAASPDATARPQLQAIDMIVLNGSLDEYSITHYPINAGNGQAKASDKGTVGGNPVINP
jgi:hypothetical protein